MTHDAESNNPVVILVCTGWREMHKLPHAEQIVTEWFDYVERAHGPIVLVIEGEQRGADLLCRGEADRRFLPHLGVPANWPLYKKAAGHIRNGKMVKIAKTLLPALDRSKVIGLAFLAPQSVGTVGMVKLMDAEGWWVEKVYLDVPEEIAS